MKKIVISLSALLMLGYIGYVGAESWGDMSKRYWQKATSYMPHPAYWPGLGSAGAIAGFGLRGKMLSPLPYLGDFTKVSAPLLGAGYALKNRDWITSPLIGAGLLSYNWLGHGANRSKDALWEAAHLMNPGNYPFDTDTIHRLQSRDQEFMNQAYQDGQSYTQWGNILGLLTAAISAGSAAYAVRGRGKIDQIVAALASASPVVAAQLLLPFIEELPRSNHKIILQTMVRLSPMFSAIASSYFRDKKEDDSSEAEFIKVGDVQGESG